MTETLTHPKILQLHIAGETSHDSPNYPYENQFVIRPDRRRCKATGVGLLSGGYDISELERAGALRVYEDPQDLLRHLEEIASRP